ncbi:hypothetical protein ADIARSV_0545 [Arcticibacter svalbardensis MN12-7]|uniref:Uncharacterized protein n=1 Tax=Arcticibacter svalbardensis MN12-7 TaxID=1150600 RepID=R9GXT0_9SPHI|nr:hypothetical protein [Arcticibacter svalbardensis]EOR96310.1 hypothetical protein ADIARSV_0545 [Arcticibacter svalbardensis MN12-7]
MIFKFNPALFYVDNAELQKTLLRLILDFTDRRYLWDFENLTEIIYNDDNAFFDNSITARYLPEPILQELEDRIDIILQQSAYISQPQKFYFTTIVIGLEADETSPNDALRISELPSLIFLENGTNDWNFIKGIIDNYANHNTKKTVFKAVQQAYLSNRLVPVGLGGAGELIKVIKAYISGNYVDIQRHKLMTVFDSDRDNSVSINNKWHNALTYLKNDRAFDITNVVEWSYANEDRINWHMLYKREIENYIPKELLFSNIEQLTEEAKKEIDQLTPDGYDFFNFDKYLEDHKNRTSELFLITSNRVILEQRCIHHSVKAEVPSGILEDIVELESIMQMVAKLI